MARCWEKGSIQTYLLLQHFQMRLHFLVSSEWGNRKSHPLEFVKRCIFLKQEKKRFISQQDISKTGRMGVRSCFRRAQLSQGDKNYLLTRFSPHLHSQGSNDSEMKCQLNMPYTGLISFDSLLHKLQKILKLSIFGNGNQTHCTILEGGELKVQSENTVN